MKILIVDDSKAMRMIVTRTLRQAGFADHTFLEASNGVEALQVIESSKPDVVLSDWNMPEMNGIDLLRKVRAASHAVKFGFVTSECTPEIRNEAKEAGAEFFVTKPFTAENFESALTPVLS